MKTERWLIISAILVLLGVTGMAAFNTILGQHQEQLAELQTETDRLEAWKYWTQIAQMPQPYSLPMEQLWISSGTGYRTNPMGGTEESLHKGVDIAGAVGDPIRAALAGEVAEHWVPPNGRQWKGHPIMGGMVVLNHGDGLYSIYGHLLASCVHEGDWVECGQLIGEVGNTGISTGPHLHFELVVDPLRYLEMR